MESVANVWKSEGNVRKSEGNVWESEEMCEKCVANVRKM